MYVLGVRDLPTKSAADSLIVFQEILQDLDNAAGKADDSVTCGVIRHIASTMSDQASTEKKFNSLLQDFKNEILPKVVEHYNELPEDAKVAVGKMYHFFCGLHPLVHFAEAASATLGELEKAEFDDKVPFITRDKSAAER